MRTSAAGFAGSGTLAGAGFGVGSTFAGGDVTVGAGLPAGVEAGVETGVADFAGTVVVSADFGDTFSAADFVSLWVSFAFESVTRKT